MQQGLNDGGGSIARTGNVQGKISASLIIIGVHHFLCRYWVTIQYALYDLNWYLLLLLLLLVTKSKEDAMEGVSARDISKRAQIIILI